MKLTNHGNQCNYHKMDKKMDIKGHMQSAHLEFNLEIQLFLCKTSHDP